MQTYALRNFFQKHIGEHFKSVRGQRFVNALFRDCVFEDVADAQFINCVMDGSEIAVDDVRKAVGVTCTINCFTFEGLKLSPVMFDAFLFNLTLTRGNDEARKRLEGIIDPKRLRMFRIAFPHIE